MNNDLISRSALLEALNKLYMAALRKTAHSVETIYELDHLSMLVNDAPTVDAEVVRHGRWTFPWTSPECSVCRKTQKWTSNYCPNCGAKMDAEVEG